MSHVAFHVALETRVDALRCAVNNGLVSLSASDRAALRRSVSAIDEALQDAKARWGDVQQDVIDNQTSHFLLSGRFDSSAPFQST